MSFDTFSRTIRKYPQLFSEIPDLEFLLKKLQIYDLINRGQIKQAEQYFFNSFKNVLENKDFHDCLLFFKLIFSNEKSKRFIQNFYKDIISEFFGLFQELLNELLQKHGNLFFLRAEVKTNDYLVNCSFNFLDSELDLEKSLIDYCNSKNGYNVWENNLLKNLEEETLKMQEEDKTFDLFNLNHYETVNIKEEIKVETPKSKINKDDPSLNSNYYEKKVINDKKKIHRFRYYNNFLKNFSPKFMKKENLDKKIIRRFRKFLREEVFKFGNPTHENKNQSKMNTKINSNLDSNSVSTLGETEVSDYGALQFAYEFSTENYLPPFKSDKFQFKSFSTQYLVWMFSDLAISNLYKQFGDDFNKKLSDNLIFEYNLNTNEPDICVKLPEYIRNLGNFYCRKNDDDEENDEENQQIDLLIKTIKNKKNNYFKSLEGKSKNFTKSKKLVCVEKKNIDNDDSIYCSLESCNYDCRNNVNDADGCKSIGCEDKVKSKREVFKVFKNVSNYNETPYLGETSFNFKFNSIGYNQDNKSNFEIDIDDTSSIFSAISTNFKATMNLNSSTLNTDFDLY